jgi:RNA binding exosome subunit
MRWTPSIVPKGHDETVYLVLDDFGRQGRAYRETDVERTDLEAVINDLMAGQYSNPITVVAFNLAERWANDVSEDIAHEIQSRADLASQDLTSSIEDFVGRHARRERQLTLRLV